MSESSSDETDLFGPPPPADNSDSSDSSSDEFDNRSSHSTTSSSAPSNPSGYQKETLQSMVALFDRQRDKLLRGKEPNSKLSDFSPEDLQAYINLVLSGDGPTMKHYIAKVESRSDIFRAPDCVLYQDVDSALIFNKAFPWDGPYDILTSFSEKKSLAGYLHAHVKFSSVCFAVRD